MTHNNPKKIIAWAGPLVGRKDRSIDRSEDVLVENPVRVISVVVV